MSELGSMSTLAANIVRLLHLALVIFVVTVPFLGGNAPWSVFAIHAMTVVTLLVHWVSGQNACFLTLLESKLRGIPSRNSFMHSIVTPVYQIDNARLREIVHAVTPVLGLISAVRLSSRWEQVKEDIKRCMAASGYAKAADARESAL